MKVNKTQGVLYIFELLVEEGFIKKEDIMSELEIAEVSFWRYIQELEAFIVNFNLPYEIYYDRKDDIYRLNKNI